MRRKIMSPGGDLGTLPMKRGGPMTDKEFRKRAVRCRRRRGAPKRNSGFVFSQRLFSTRAVLPLRRRKRRPEMMSDCFNCRGDRIPSRFLRSLDGFCRDRRCKICSKDLPSQKEAQETILHNLAIAMALTKDSTEKIVLYGIQDLLEGLWDRALRKRYRTGSKRRS